MELTEPTTDLHRSWLESWREWGTLDQDGAATHLVERHGLDLTDAADFAAFVRLLIDDADPRSPRPAGFVPSTTFWLVEDGGYLGSIQLRHSIGTEFLSEFGGHIGYGVRPGARGRGLARQALRDMCGHAAGLGLGRLLLTCREDNTASAKVIEACGGEFESLRAVDDLARRYGYLTPMRRYWIALTEWSGQD